MGSATPEGRGTPDIGRAVIEDLARAAFPTCADTSRQPDPAELTPSHEDGEDGAVVSAVADKPVLRPTPLVIELGVEPTTRHITTLPILATLVVAVLATAVAYGDPRPVTIGLALLLVVVLLLTWRFRSRRPTAAVIATGSRLEVVRDGSRHVFDLSCRDNPVDVIGLPGDRQWRVLFHRDGMAPYVVDASMVDPQGFMRVLHAQRSQVTYRPH